jgi:hypothetical protein
VDLEVIVTTWGSDEWHERGRVTAKYNSAWHFHSYDPKQSAGAARNAAVEHERQLLTPALALGDRPPECYGSRDIINGLNPCPIGTLIHRTMFDAVGGFWDEPAWEDWSLFRRAVLIGAEITFVHDAVYHAADNPRGRNSTVRNPQALRRQILESHRRWTP